MVLKTVLYTCNNKTLPHDPVKGKKHPGNIVFLCLIFYIHFLDVPKMLESFKHPQTFFSTNSWLFIFNILQSSNTISDLTNKKKRYLYAVS